MEVIKPYIGKYDGCSVFLNNGKYGYYLNYKDGLYSVPQCFQKPQFRLDDAIKIIEYKKKMKQQQIESVALCNIKDVDNKKKDFKADVEPDGASSDEDIIEKINKTRKKKPKENI